MIDDYTRRRFLRNATVATAAVFLPHTYAETHRSPQRANQLTPTAQSAITLTDCLALTPEEMAATSPRVQQARNYLTQQIATITDQTLQQTISTLYHQPTPLSIARMNDDERRTVWQELRAKGYTDAQENDFLPPSPRNVTMTKLFSARRAAATKAIMPILAGSRPMSRPMSRSLTGSSRPIPMSMATRLSVTLHSPPSCYTICISRMFSRGRQITPAAKSKRWREPASTTSYPSPN
ncbi:twin-arginine translocation signal domain-containing protein [Edwardsiella hoshinae]|uniref:twin-arginine translocation signal domain-containing protein n=1 Tax=Edwardsiella hoshinae TaxID=93378 RepID=UPI002FBED379